MDIPYRTLDFQIGSSRFYDVVHHNLTWVVNLELFPASQKLLTITSFDNNYDCTFKESLYSTYPYLTYSSKRKATPVMRSWSMHGFREEYWLLILLSVIAVAKSSVKKYSNLDACVCTLNRPPHFQTPPPTSPLFLHPYSHPLNTSS